ncbi:hypothetical protein ACFL9S_07045 [Erwinia sp. AnSW2-5]|uniref:hypothetical protein n=1 Tax=Erwinia sp. AnSW2-5 TaxID=3367692 RepID=UPI00385D2572
MDLEPRKAFAAETADAIYTRQETSELAQAFREDVRRQLVARGLYREDYEGNTLREQLG